MRKLTISLALIGTLLALEVSALGLSHIQVYSKLNESLNAKINVLSIPSGEARNVKVSLASARAFQRAGLDRPYLLTKIDFKVQEVPEKNRAVIKLTTQQPVKEPFLNFLVEVRWPGGRILREYTALLDPPLYKPASIQRLSRRISEEAQLTPVSTKPPRETRSRRTETTRKTSQQRKFKPPKKKRVTRKATRSASYTVVRNDTLWKIAQRTRSKKESIRGQMLKIYRANPGAFIRRNMNLLKAGKVLRIPGWKGKMTSVVKNPPLRGTGKPQNTGTAPQTATTRSKTKPATPKPEADVKLGGHKSNENGAGSPNSSQVSGNNTAEINKLRNQVEKVREKNYSIESENKDLKEDLTATKKMVMTMEKQFKKFNEMISLQNRQLAELQKQLKRQAAENRKLQNKIAALQSGQGKAQIAEETTRFQPTLKSPLETGQQGETSGTTGPSTPEPKVPEEQQPEDQTQVAGGQDTVTPGEQTGSSEGKGSSTTGDGEGGGEGQVKTEEKKPDDDINGKSNGAAPDDVEKEEPTIVATAQMFVDEQIPGGWLTVGGIGGGTLLLFLRGRSSKSLEPPEWKGGAELSEEEIEDELDRLEAEGKPLTDGESDNAPIQDIDDMIQQIGNDGKLETDDGVDPVFDEDLREEIGVYKEFGNFEKAKDLMNEAIEKYPDHAEYRLELLELHAAAKEVDEFEQEARMAVNWIRHRQVKVLALLLQRQVPQHWGQVPLLPLR